MQSSAPCSFVARLWLRLCLAACVALVGCQAAPYVADGTDEDDDAAPETRKRRTEVTPSSEDTKSAAPPSAPTTDLHYSVVGDPSAPAVVFLHGGPGATSRMFELTAQASIARLGYRVVAYDQRGSARSPEGTVKAYSFAAATKDLDDLIGALGLTSPILLAHSFGGAIALHYLERFKGKAKGAILVASPIDFPATYDTTLAACAVRYQAWGRWGDAQKVASLRSSMFPNGVRPPFAYADAEITATIRCQTDAMLYFTPLPTPAGMSFAVSHGQDPDVRAVNPTVGSAFHANDRIGHADLTPLLRAHRHEVVGIYAPRWDVMFSAAHLATIQASTKAFFTLDDAGHFPFVDQPAAFTATVDQAIDRLE